MPKDYTAWKKEFAAQLYWNGRKPVEGAVCVFIDCVSCTPRSYTKSERIAALGGLAAPRGDVDNMAKSVMDACTEAGVWLDDSQVSTLTVSKRYGEADSIRVRIEVQQPLASE